MNTNYPTRKASRQSAKMRDGNLRIAVPAAVAAILLFAPSAHALPSFARQTDMQCISCHTEFPILTPLGRQFKLDGYTSTAENTQFPPFAVMLMPSFTRTAKDQYGGAAPGFGDNNNFAVTQASVFYGGRLFGPYATDIFGKDAATFANRFGVFSQATYDGIGKVWHWDNTEFRYADKGTVAGHDASFGFYLNNNPTLQDLWNTTPAWGYPFSQSGLAPTPDAAPLINGGLAQQVGGLGTYVMLSDSLYLDVAGYRTLGAGFQNQVGIDPTGETQIAGVAPYWRIAYDQMVGDAHWETGAFGLDAGTYPGRDQSAGRDHIDDIGLDTQYQISSGVSDFTGMLSYVYEHESWDASSALGNTTNTGDSLWNVKATVNYLYDKTFGGTVQYFFVDGSSDPLLYSGSATGSATSDGLILQMSYLPFNKGGGPAFWPRSNVKFSVQYVVYNRFNGARTNYDGAGSNARDNNTLYFECWIVF